MRKKESVMKDLRVYDQLCGGSGSPGKLLRELLNLILELEAEVKMLRAIKEAATELVGDFTIVDETFVALLKQDTEARQEAIKRTGISAHFGEGPCEDTTCCSAQDIKEQGK